jgi:Tfp pilus assembly protein PilF
MPPNKFHGDVLEMGDELEKAEFAIHARRYDLAIQLMRKELIAHPENAVAFYTIARAYKLKRIRYAAFDAICESLRLDPSVSNSHMLYGHILMDLGIFDKAEQEFLTSFSINPANHHAHYLYAHFLLHKKKKIAKAREHISIALAMDASNANYHVVMGGVLAAEGKLDEAEKEYLRALSLDPDDYIILNDYGVHLLNRKNRPAEAFEFFRQAMLRNPNDPRFENNLLLAVKSKHKFVSLFSLNSFYLRRHRFLAITIYGVTTGLILVGYWVSLATSNWALILLTLCLFLLVILVNPIFNLLVKRGWLK